MNNLPEEIIQYITQYLPSKKLLDLKQTSKKFNTFFSKDFILKHNSAIIIQKNIKKILAKEQARKLFFHRVLVHPEYRIKYFCIHEPIVTNDPWLSTNYVQEFDEERDPHICLTKFTSYLGKIFYDHLSFLAYNRYYVDEKISENIVKSILNLTNIDAREKWLCTYIFKI